jgi:hypothetical protein
VRVFVQEFGSGSSDLLLALITLPRAILQSKIDQHLEAAFEKLRDSFSRGIFVSKGGNSGTPETQRGLQKFHRCKSRALVRPNQAGDAACQIVIRFEVGEDQLLGRDNRSRNRKQTAVRTNVDGLRLLLKRLVGEPSVEKDAHCRADAPSAALFEEQRRTRVWQFPPKTQPSPQERFQAGHRKSQLKNTPSRGTP